MRAIHFWVGGRVQGVFFRATTRHEAQRRGLTGWVRNQRDGRVEGWAEGDDDAVQDLVAYLREGPARARVDHLDVQEVEPEGHSAFVVRR